MPLYFTLATHDFFPGVLDTIFIEKYLIYLNYSLPPNPQFSSFQTFCESNKSEKCTFWQIMFFFSFLNIIILLATFCAGGWGGPDLPCRKGLLPVGKVLGDIFGPGVCLKVTFQEIFQDFIVDSTEFAPI